MPSRKGFVFWEVFSKVIHEKCGMFEHFKRNTQVNNYKRGSNICGNNRWNTVSFTADDYVGRWRQLSQITNVTLKTMMSMLMSSWLMTLKIQSIMLMTMTTQVLSGRTVGTVRKGCALGYYRLNRIIKESKLFNDSTIPRFWSCLSVLVMSLAMALD